MGSGPKSCIVEDNTRFHAWHDWGKSELARAGGLGLRRPLGPVLPVYARAIRRTSAIIFSIPAETSEIELSSM